MDKPSASWDLVAMGTRELGHVRDQRSRILDAIVDLAGKGGCRGSSPAAIAQAAGVSEPVFYEHFGDAEECFLAAFDESIEIGERLVAARVDRDQPWSEQVSAATKACLEAIVAEPARARLCLVESQKVGEAAATRYQLVRNRACDWLMQGRALSGCEPELPHSFELFFVSGIAWIMQQRLDEGRLDHLSEDLQGVLQSLLVPYVGDADAANVSGGESLARAAS